MYFGDIPRGRPGPRKAVALLVRSLDIEATPRPLRDLLCQVILSEEWESQQSAAEERAESWEANALTLIKDALGKPDRFGRPSVLEINSSSDYLIQGAAFVEGTETHEGLQHKSRRKHIFRLLSAMRSLSAQEFEGFCTRVIQKIGAEASCTTKLSGDEGIDFFGKLKLKNHIFPDDVAPTLQSQLNVWLIGQAKHYRAIKVATPDIRELVGSVELARHSAFSSIKGSPYPDLDILACDPVFILFFTTGEISLDGWRLLERSGVVGMDGLMLSAFLCDRGVCQSEGHFSESEFQVWARSTA